MREILFRGRRDSNGVWYEGHYVTRNGMHFIQQDDDGAIKKWWVNPETIGQYTGANDRNGKKIFEGDILDTTNSNCRIWFVDYKNTAFCSNQGNVNYSCVLDEFMVCLDVEVIGNIHDNPELLEVAE